MVRRTDRPSPCRVPVGALRRAGGESVGVPPLLRSQVHGSFALGVGLQWSAVFCIPPEDVGWRVTLTVVSGIELLFAAHYLRMARRARREFSR